MMPSPMHADPSFWSSGIAALEPYVPGEQPRIPGLVKLNTNEHPWPPSARVADAIARAAREGLERYPDPESTALREALAARLGLAASQVFVGNGSDEVLAHAFFAFFRRDEPLLFPDVTYSFYHVWAQLYGIAAETVPVDAGLRIDVAALAARAAQGCGGLVVANPNAPTGLGLPLAAIERLLAAAPQRVLLVDEAYVDFGGESAVGLIARHPNVKRAGIASAGPLDPIGGVLLDPTNFASASGTWGHVPLARILSRKLRIPVLLENDAAAAMLAEHWVGAAKGYENAMILTLGTGLGTGIICNGALVRAGQLRIILPRLEDRRGRVMQIPVEREA